MTDVYDFKPGQIIWSRTAYVAIYKPWPLSDKIEESFTHQFHIPAGTPVLFLERIERRAGSLQGLAIFHCDQQWLMETKYYWIGSRTSRIMGLPPLEVLPTDESERRPEWVIQANQ